MTENAPASRISRPVLADRVKDYITERIMDGTYPPASRIIETSIAKELGVSQAPVREALRALEAVGLVQIEPFRGARVHVPSPRDILDSNVVRLSIESLAIELAPPGPALADDLAATYSEMLRRAAAGDAHGFAEADVSFHAAIIAMPGNQVLSRVWQSLEPLTRTYMTTLIPDLGLTWAAHLHAPVLDALNAGSHDGAVAALRRHFDEINQRILSSLDGAEHHSDQSPGG